MLVWYNLFEIIYCIHHWIIINARTLYLTPCPIMVFVETDIINFFFNYAYNIPCSFDFKFNFGFTDKVFIKKSSLWAFKVYNRFIVYNYNTNTLCFFINWCFRKQMFLGMYRAGVKSLRMVLSKNHQEVEYCFKTSIQFI